MPELWLTNSKDYRNRKLKAQSYDRLLRHMRTCDPYANIHMVKRKINNLRTSYRRELRKVLESRAAANGTYSGEEYVPSLWYFNELEFLYDQETGEAQTLIDAEPDHALPDSKPEPEQQSEPEYLKDAYNENVVEVSLEEQEPVSGEQERERKGRISLAKRNTMYEMCLTHVVFKHRLNFLRGICSLNQINLRYTKV